MTASGWLWALTMLGFAVLIAIDLRWLRADREVGFGQAVRWSLTYVGLALLFGVGLLVSSGSEPAAQFLTGFAVEKALSVDNLFVFAVLLSGFAVPARQQARVLSLGVLGALVLRGVLIAVGVGAVSRFSVLFLVFGLFLAYTAIRLLRARGDSPDVRDGRVVRWIRRRVPVVDDDSGALLVRRGGRFALTGLSLAVVAILSADVVFALDSIPAVLGVTQNSYLVVCANAFALLGLRPLYFLLVGLRERLVHLHYGLAVVLGFIGIKLMLHYLHEVVPAVPDIPTSVSLLVIAVVFAVVTLTSLRASRTRIDARN